MADPTVPNYKSGVGRLAVDRFDFQDHVDGYRFRHKADQTDLFPTLVISSSTVTNVQDALEALVAIAYPTVIPDATTTTNGLVRLAGDISGVASSVTVVKLQTRPVSTLAPSNNDVLTWDAAGGNWKPAAATNSFTAGGDLTGSNVSQQVVNITGTAGTAGITATTLQFANTVVSPIFTQASQATDANSLTILGQSSTGVNTAGGHLYLSGGAATGSGREGGTYIGMNSSGSNLIQLIDIDGREVLSLLSVPLISNVEMPADTGSQVIFIADTATAPGAGIPSGGTILYSNAEKLYVVQGDGDKFAVGSNSNPNIWGAAGQQVYEERTYVQSTTNVGILAFSYTLPDNTTTHVNCTMIAKEVGAVEGLASEFSYSYVKEGGALGAPIDVVIESTQFTAGAGAWTVTATFTESGNDMRIWTGGNAATVINWTIITKLTMCA